jgi:hypothetical protein
MSQLTTKTMTQAFEIEYVQITEKNIEEVCDWLIEKNNYTGTWDYIAVEEQNSEGKRSKLIQCSAGNCILEEVHSIGTYLVYFPIYRRLGIFIDPISLTEQQFKELIGEA